MLPETPDFWQHRGLAAYALLPFSWLYNAGYCIKQKLARPYKSNLPVICVGGIVAGGSGKTPVVHAILKLAREEMGFVNPVILTRGYGGAVQGPSLVDPHAHNYTDVGDEALLHVTQAPTIVSKDRAAGLRLAEAMGADLVIMDDGLQNTSVVKTLSFAVVDAQYKFGNGFMLPAGPLREPVACALSRCDAVILTNGSAVIGDGVTFNTTLGIVSTNDKTIEYVAFAGLGHPEKFKKTLEANGFNLAAFRAFPDHHPYTPEEIEELLRVSGNSTLITTQKDLTRIPAAFWNDIHVLKIEVSFTDKAAICTLIRKALGR